MREARLRADSPVADMTRVTRRSGTKPPDVLIHSQNHTLIERIWSGFHGTGSVGKTSYGFWLIPEIGVPIVMLAFHGVIRKVGAALLVTLPAPLWTYLLLGGAVLLGPTFIVYLV
jgi:hypothetical protein